MDIRVKPALAEDFVDADWIASECGIDTSLVKSYDYLIKKSREISFVDLGNRRVTEDQLCAEYQIRKNRETPAIDARLALAIFLEFHHGRRDQAYMSMRKDMIDSQRAARAVSSSVTVPTITPPSREDRPQPAQLAQPVQPSVEPQTTHEQLAEIIRIAQSLQVTMRTSVPVALPPPTSADRFIDAIKADIESKKPVNQRMFGADMKVAASPLYEKYRTWCPVNGEEVPMPIGKFGAIAKGRMRTSRLSKAITYYLETIHQAPN